MTVPTTAAPTEPGAPAAPRTSGRRDHERNRGRIIAAARQLFAVAGGADVQLKDVAETAGVSQATLFRHIGSKQALLVMAYEDRVPEMIRAADAALAADDPWTGLAELVRTLAGWVHEDRGLWDFAAGEVVTAHPEHAAMVARVGAVLDRAHAAGVLRADVGLVDLVPLLAFATHSVDDRWRIHADVVLTGMRAS